MSFRDQSRESISNCQWKSSISLVHFVIFHRIIITSRLRTFTSVGILYLDFRTTMSHQPVSPGQARPARPAGQTCWRTAELLKVVPTAIVRWWAADAPSLPHLGQSWGTRGWGPHNCPWWRPSWHRAWCCSSPPLPLPSVILKYLPVCLCELPIACYKLSICLQTSLSKSSVHPIINPR